ncbi:hypothetical protein STEG23_005427, partial [Scotinomys teguina]
MTLLWTEGDSPEDSWVVCSGDQLTESPVVMKPSSNEKSIKKKCMKFAGKWTNLKNIMLSQITDSERQMLYVLPQRQILDLNVGMCVWMR